MKRYFIETKVPDVANVRDNLWNENIDQVRRDPATLLEQYKLYIELADRVSARRSAANTFFLTLNTAVFTAIGVFWQNPPTASPWLGVFPAAVLVFQCLVWFWTIRSYRQLNAAKWVVVGALEEQLPASPWWRAEWKALGEGKDPSLYWPLTHVEQWVPFVFAVAYIGGFLALAIH